MKQELEIEYKNLLTKSDYQKIFDSEFSLMPHKGHQKIIQKNYYFDTKENLLKKQGAALRIRTTFNDNELTFKVPSDDFLMETNLKLKSEQVVDILKKSTLRINELTKEPIKINLKGINRNSLYIHFNSFKNIRFEKQVETNLLVLDQTTFQNGMIDYELEVEGQHPRLAKDYFHSILRKYSITHRPSSPKIARAEENK